MQNIKIITFAVIFIFGTTITQAQSLHTWVSGSGNDANPCTYVAPCKTFAGAIAKTSVGGEIDAMDRGEFGPVTITKAITIDGGNQGLSIMAVNTNGIVVAAQPDDVVILRNLKINGVRGSDKGGINGIRFISGADLNVENCVIFGFNNNGVDIALGTASSVHIINTIIKNVGGAGVSATSTTSAVTVGIDNSQIMVTNIGVHAGDKSRVDINRSFIEHATTNGVQVDATAGDSIATVDHSDISYNGTGVNVTGGAFVVLADNKVFDNGTAVSATGGTCNSYGTNSFRNPDVAARACPLISPGQQ